MICIAVASKKHLKSNMLTYENSYFRILTILKGKRNNHPLCTARKGLLLGFPYTCLDTQGLGHRLVWKDLHWYGRVTWMAGGGTAE